MEEDGSMEVHFTGRHYEIPPELKENVAKKLEKLNNLEDRMGEVRVILTAEGYRQIAEITLRAGGHDFVGRDESGDMQASVDLVMEKLAEQLKRFKERRKERHRRDAARSGSPAERVISRRETVETISALTVDEALEQLDDDGGEVLVFENTANNRKTTVLYRREDGSYGLIEPAS
jgi:putative sigma-54 modulation protein